MLVLITLIEVGFGRFSAFLFDRLAEKSDQVNFFDSTEQPVIMPFRLHRQLKAGRICALPKSLCYFLQILRKLHARQMGNVRRMTELSAVFDRYADYSAVVLAKSE